MSVSTITAQVQFDIKSTARIHLIEFPLSKIFVVQEESSSRQMFINERENFCQNGLAKESACK